MIIETYQLRQIEIEIIFLIWTAPLHSKCSIAELLLGPWLVCTMWMGFAYTNETVI